MATAKKLHCFLIPVHNEGVVIRDTIRSFQLAGVSLDDVFVVDDCSTDATIEELTKAAFPYLSINNILCLSLNVGKTRALVAAFAHFNLAERYTFFNTLDGDTLLAPDYMEKLVPILNDASKSTAAVASRVCSIKSSLNAYTSYRAWEYWLMQVTYKRAQGYINCITVLPGCGTTFRTSVFKKLSENLRPEMLTEDMLWTIRIHLEDLGKILYAHYLEVYTQDPDRFSSYFKQNCRWFQGGWQVFREQKMWQIFKSRINAETAFLFGEGVFFSALFTFALVCFSMRWFPAFTHYFFTYDCLLFLGLTLVGALLELDGRLVLWMPFFYALRVVKCFIFLHSFIKIMVFQSDKRVALKWNKVARY
jgi:cellulose synthase/poly-beta-1,6-N-acetylglucosamine synthase-like glycosyltransferase